MGYRACLGLMALARKYGEDRLEAACARAVRVNARTYRSVLSILKTSLDRQPLEPTPAQSDWITPDHEHLRGPGYYH